MKIFDFSNFLPHTFNISFIYRVPVTKLGRLVKENKIKTIEEIYLSSLPIKEYQIVDRFFGPALKDEVMKIMPVQKQTRAGQRTRFKVIIIGPAIKKKKNIINVFH